MRRRFALVHNPNAGASNLRALERSVGLLRRSGGEVTPLNASSAADATQRVAALARQGGTDAVIAAGGDGTIRAVAAGAAGTELSVGIIPLGTGNVMKYEIGLGRSAREIAETLLHGPVLNARTGLANGQLFLLMAGAGFDGGIVANLNERAKRRLGRLAYAGPLLSALATPPRMFDVDVDGTAYDVSWAIVSNARHYGGSFVLTRETELGAEGLVAILVMGASRGDVFKAALALGLGRMADPATRPKGILVLPAKRVVMGAHCSVPLEIDGDEAGMTPVTITSGGPRVSLIVPSAHVADPVFRHTNHVSLRE